MDHKLPSLSSPSSPPIPPRLILHGGAGNILPSNLPPSEYTAYTTSLLSALSSTHHHLLTHSSLSTATFAVSLLEDNPLFNSGHGAVFTRAGTNELEASIMVSRGAKKRGVGVMGLRRVRNPIKLAREMLERGERDLEGGNGEHRGPMRMVQPGGAQGHCQIFGEQAEELARAWGVELVEQGYFWTQKRWDEHIKGLEREKKGGEPGYDGRENVSQGTCGAVVLDKEGVCCAATSTGGMTNKLPGRIGDTPTLGAGFWAEEWMETLRTAPGDGGPTFALSDELRGLVADCLPGLSLYGAPRYESLRTGEGQPATVTRATAISGTGNGDSFLRLNAVRTVSAIARYGGRGRGGEGPSLREAMREMTGPGGELQRSAGERWGRTGEGEGGMIGIECVVVRGGGEVREVRTEVVQEFNCGGMFRAWVDEGGMAVCRVWREGQELPEGYEREGRRWDLRDWYEEKS